MKRIVLDSGALIALDRNEHTLWGVLRSAARAGTAVVTHGGVIAQTWRGPRQARLGQALAAVDVITIDAPLGRRAGQLLAATGLDDAVDALLVAISRDGDRIFTGDVEDLARLSGAAFLDVEIVPV